MLSSTDRFFSHVNIAPKSLKSLLLSRPGIAERRLNTLRGKIFQDYNDLSEKMWDWEATGVTSDDLSQAMLSFLPEVENLAQLPGPDSLLNAYQVAQELKNFSYAYLGELRHASGYGSRVSDEAVDLLLAKLIRKRMAARHIWHWQIDLEEFDFEAKKMKRHAIVVHVDDWYPMTRRWLRKLLE